MRKTRCTAAREEHRIPEENTGFAGSIFLATLLGVTGPLKLLHDYFVHLGAAKQAENKVSDIVTL